VKDNISQAIAQFDEAPTPHPDFPERSQNLRLAKGLAISLLAQITRIAANS